MHKNATKCNKTLSKWCKDKHGASKIIDKFGTYQYVTLIQNQINEGGDPQLGQNLEFIVPTAEILARMYIKNPPYVDKNRDEVRATPVENIVATKELLEHNQSPAALETAVKLMTKALVQQEKATLS
jgi:hypothetical protein